MKWPSYRRAHKADPFTAVTCAIAGVAGVCAPLIRFMDGMDSAPWQWSASALSVALAVWVFTR